MERFIKAVMCIWGFFFMVSGTLVIYSIIKYSIRQDIYLYSLGIGFIAGIVSIIPIIIYYFFDSRDKNEIKELLNKTTTILNELK